MGDEVRIGVEPPTTPPPRPGKVIVVAAGLILLIAAGAWLLGIFGDQAPLSTTAGSDHPLPPPASTTTAGTTTTLPLENRLERARTFWTALGVGDAMKALAAVTEPTSAAGDLIAFVAAFRPAFTVSDCEEFFADAVACRVVVTNTDLLAIGTPEVINVARCAYAENPAVCQSVLLAAGGADQVLTVADDGWFDVPSVLGFAAGRLSLYALQVHTDEVREACPVTHDPAVPHLPIAGSTTPACGAYLAGLVPEYLEYLEQSEGTGE